jgi:hypothetical protein
MSGAWRRKEQLRVLGKAAGTAVVLTAVLRVGMPPERASSCAVVPDQLTSSFRDQFLDDIEIMPVSVISTIRQRAHCRALRYVRRSCSGASC